ncbi:hypothetical protein LB506_007631 [Fusarium annulatum]|nr:hypothetical protein LB506_007631 [Fusarium annulatum]
MVHGTCSQHEEFELPECIKRLAILSIQMNQQSLIHYLNTYYQFSINFFASMRFITTLTTAVATLASTATAAPKTETFATASVYAFNRDQSTHKFVDVPFGKLTHIDYQITDLELRGVQFLLPDGTKIDPDKVTCQMYKDNLGTQPGSAAFTKKTPAHISLFNPVQFGWVLCYVNVGSA